MRSGGIQPPNVSFARECPTHLTATNTYTQHRLSTRGGSGKLEFLMSELFPPLLLAVCIALLLARYQYRAQLPSMAVVYDLTYPDSALTTPSLHSLQEWVQGRIAGATQQIGQIKPISQQMLANLELLVHRFRATLARHI